MSEDEEKVKKLLDELADTLIKAEQLANKIKIAYPELSYVMEDFATEFTMLIAEIARIKDELKGIKELRIK